MSDAGFIEEDPLVLDAITRLSGDWLYFWVTKEGVFPAYAPGGNIDLLPNSPPGDRRPMAITAGDTIDFNGEVWVCIDPPAIPPRARRGLHRLRRALAGRGPQHWTLPTIGKVFW